MGAALTSAKPDLERINALFGSRTEAVNLPVNGFAAEVPCVRASKEAMAHRRASASQTAASTTSLIVKGLKEQTAKPSWGKRGQLLFPGRAGKRKRYPTAFLRSAAKIPVNSCPPARAGFRRVCRAWEAQCYPPGA